MGGLCLWGLTLSLFLSLSLPRPPQEEVSFVTSGGFRLNQNDDKTCDHIEALRHHFRSVNPAHPPSDYDVDVTLATTARRASRDCDEDDDNGFLVPTRTECPLALIQYEDPTSINFGICCISTTSTSCLTCGGRYCHHLDRTLKIAGRLCVS